MVRERARAGLEPGGPVQCALVLGLELAELAGLQSPQPDRPDADADQPAHREPDRVVPPPDLAFAALDHHESHSPSRARAPAAPDPARRPRLDGASGPVLEVDPPLQTRELSVRGRPIDLRQVLLLDLV